MALAGDGQDMLMGTSGWNEVPLEEEGGGEGRGVGGLPHSWREELCHPERALSPKEPIEVVLAPDQASSPKRCSGQVHLDRSWTEVGPGLLEGLYVLAGLAALWCPSHPPTPHPTPLGRSWTVFSVRRWPRTSC